MQAHRKTSSNLTKQQEREAMRDLMEQRERRSAPRHRTPSWVNQFWRRLAS